ncbi:DUF2975 domain-containing protein [Planosporangium sp. 12N6]|uniref:DUF2975 domain-containing protein n=1 Tax=Planosporangium spinosum TaxID=3402278 RepID=UPI003CF11658
MSLSERLRRPDWLAEMQAVLVTGLVLVGVGVVVAAVSLVRRDPIPVDLPSEGIVRPDLSGVRPNVRLGDGGTVQVLVDHPTSAQVAWYLAGSAPVFLVVAYTLVTLLRIVRTARRGDPFAAVNVRRLRVLGLVVLVGGVADTVTGAVSAFALGSSVAPGVAPGATIELSGWWYLVGFGFLAIAEVVSRGRTMRAELDEVI